MHSFWPGGAPFRRFHTRGSFDELAHRCSVHPILRDFICAGFRRRLPSSWDRVGMGYFASKTGPGRGVPLGGSLGIQGNRCHPRGMRNLKPRLLSLEWGGAATPRAMNFLRGERGWLGVSVLCLSVTGVPLKNQHFPGITALRFTIRDPRCTQSRKLSHL